jgi:predicted RND superfamily exporter protein
MSSMIGLIMLMGIATKNSILLVDYVILARREHGLDRWNALLDACRKRARPIVMTTIAMGAGMLPIAIGIGTDPSFRAPMAIVVIGGLITSTFLSLLVIPVVFTYVDDAIVWIRQHLPKPHAMSEKLFAGLVRIAARRASGGQMAQPFVRLARAARQLLGGRRRGSAHSRGQV